MEKEGWPPWHMSNRIQVPPVTEEVRTTLPVSPGTAYRIRRNVRDRRPICGVGLWDNNGCLPRAAHGRKVGTCLGRRTDWLGVVALTNWEFSFLWRKVPVCITCAFPNVYFCSQSLSHHCDRNACHKQLLNRHVCLAHSFRGFNPLW